MVFSKKIDSLGRIVIPKSIRDSVGFKDGDEIYFKVKDNKVILEKDNQSFSDWLNSRGIELDTEVIEQIEEYFN